MFRRGRVAAGALIFIVAASCGARAQGAVPAREKRAAKLIGVLKSDAPLERKFAACRELAELGSARATPVLAGLLTDPKLSHMARYALEPSPDPAAGKALRDALDTLKGELLLGAIHSVAMRHDAEAVGALRRMLRSPDARVAAAAAGALGRIGAAQAAEALAELRKTATGASRTAAADASLRAAQELLRRGERSQAAAIFKELQADTWPKHVRLGAFVGLLAVEPDEAPARIMRAVAGSDAVLRATAIACVPTLAGEGVVARFAAELAKAPADAQMLLIRALARRSGSGAALRPALATAVASPAATVRLAAIEALGAVGGADSVPLLCSVLSKGATAAEKQAAASSLRALDGKAIDSALLACMKTSPPATRPEIIAALADRKATGAVEQLLRHAAEQDDAVRSAALKAIGRLASPERLPALMALLMELKGDAGRADAERAIVQVSRQLPDAQRSAPTLAAFGKATDPATRSSLLRVLGAIADAPALQAVQAAARSGDPTVLDTAIRVLVGWPDARPLRTLQQLSRASTNPTHRVLALRGCVRLLGLGHTSTTEALRILTDLASRATRVEDKRLVLSGLAAVADPAALKAIEPFLRDPATHDEAELAMVKAARAVSGMAPSEAGAAAKRLAAESRNTAVRTQAAAVVRLLGQLGDYVTAWQVTGPYTQEGKDGSQLIDVAFPPESGDAKGVAWRILPIRTEGKQPWMLQLDPLFGGADRACYVRTWVHSDKAQAARLEFGTDDGSKVWLNGTIVHADGAGGAAAPGEHRVPAPLRKGWNALQMKVTQYTGPWQFCLRVRSPKGEPLPGLRVRATPPTE